MRTILSIGLTALVASSSGASAETTIVVLEFGPGGSVHRSASSGSAESTSPAAVASFWNVLHRPSSSTSSSKRAPTMGQHAGMSVVPDLFTRADAGIVIGLRADSLKSMPNAKSLLSDDDAAAPSNVVGRLRIPGNVGAELVKLVAPSDDVEMVEIGADAGRRLLSTAEAAASGGKGGGIEALSLVVDASDAGAASAADEQLGRMLSTLKDRAAVNGKTVVLHLVVDREGETAGRRLQDQDANADGNANSYSYNQKSMYEIQSFNLYLWTSVGLFVVVAMVMGAFIDMPLFPDTLLFGESGKMAGSD
ncbi:hypothetical protein ACHAW5_000609 [Stephanodiscus triporus]|uniref:Uncharacterized protein n=1 Tax=Stephanodiscus triporus TaxID=2934178 RepID=A0ABD3MWK7_9STRA